MASDGYRRGYVSFAHFLLYCNLFTEKPFAPIITSVSLHPTDVRAVVVTWQPQFDGNTPILRYSIEYKVGAISRPGGYLLIIIYAYLYQNFM